MRDSELDLWRRVGGVGVGCQGWEWSRRRKPSKQLFPPKQEPRGFESDKEKILRCPKLSYRGQRVEGRGKKGLIS